MALPLPIQAAPPSPHISLDQEPLFFSDEVALRTQPGVYGRALWYEHDTGVSLVRLSVAVPDNLDSIIHDLRTAEIDRLRFVPPATFSYDIPRPAVTLEILYENGIPTDATFFPSYLTLTDFAKRRPEMKKIRLHAPRRVFDNLRSTLGAENGSPRAVIDEANSCAGVLFAERNIPTIYQHGKRVSLKPSTEPSTPWAAIEGLERYVALYQLRSLVFGFDHSLGQEAVTTIAQGLPLHHRRQSWA